MFYSFLLLIRGFSFWGFPLFCGGSISPPSSSFLLRVALNPFICSGFLFFLWFFLADFPAVPPPRPRTLFRICSFRYANHVRGGIFFHFFPSPLLLRFTGGRLSLRRLSAEDSDCFFCVLRHLVLKSPPPRLNLPHFFFFFQTCRRLGIELCAELALGLFAGGASSWKSLVIPF